MPAEELQSDLSLDYTWLYGDTETLPTNESCYLQMNYQWCKKGFQNRVIYILQYIHCNSYYIFSLFRIALFNEIALSSKIFVFSMVTPEKSSIKEGANTADANTHTLLTKHTWSHSTWQQGNAAVNSTTRCSTDPPIHCPHREKHAELYKKTLTCHIFTSASVCLCFASSSERVVRWDKEAEAPHPSSHADVNRYRSGPSELP